MNAKKTIKGMHAVHQTMYRANFSLGEQVDALTEEVEALRAAHLRAVTSLKNLQEGAAIALNFAPETGTVADFLAAIHREAVRGQLLSDEVVNEDAALKGAAQ